MGRQSDHTHNKCVGRVTALKTIRSSLEEDEEEETCLVKGEALSEEIPLEQKPK